MLSTTSMMSLLLLALAGADGLIASSIRVKEQQPTRRSVLQFAATSALLPATAQAADGVTIVRTSNVRVRAWPAVEYMEPVVELKQLLDGLVEGVKDEANWPFIRKRLDKFFSGGPGGIFSDRFFYIGASAQYVLKIEYEDSGPTVEADKAARQEPVLSTMEALQELRAELKSTLPVAAVVRGCAARAQDGVFRWLAQVPATDVQHVDALIRAVRAADLDRNGELSPAELSTLPPDQQTTWKARQSLFG